MAAGDIRKLWKVHLVDQAILEIRKRAASIDPGRRIQAQIEILNKELAERDGLAKTLSGELTDLELKQRQIDEKIKKFDKDLYGGKVVNPREVENIQREIEALKRQRGEMDVRLLELWDLVPPAKQESAGTQKAIDERRAELSVHQHKAVQEKQKLEAEFKKNMAERPSAIEEVPRAMLDRYESIRQKNGGIGMARIIAKTGTCEMCGLKLPTKTVEAAKEERLVTCEGCHRLLYYSEGIV